MIDAVPPSPPVIIVEDAATHGPTFFLGFMAVGDEPAMRSLEKAAAQVGLPAGRTKNDRDESEVMILFPAGTDQTCALSLYRDAAAGKFGKLALEVTIAPGSAASDGKIDIDTEVTVEPPGTIVVPRP